MFMKMTAEQKLAKAALDIYKNPSFAPFFGAAAVGRIVVTDALPTAGTDGIDEMYNREWVLKMPMKQVRAVRCHEVLHKFFKHTLLYKDLTEKDADACNSAMDYFINITLDDLDPKHEFIEWPTDYPPLLDAKYRDWTVVQIFNDIRKQQKNGGKGGNGKPGNGKDIPGGHGGFDVHQMHGQNGGKQRSDEELKKIAEQLENAIRQGALLAGKLHGNKQINVDGIQHVTRDWREPLKDFIMDACAGEELETWDSIHRRSDAFPELMPGYYDEQIGELVIAADTSGSMVSLYPILFSHIAAIMRQVKPTKVHVIWWDTQVAKHQEFLPEDYDKIGGLLAPAGGGGTSPQCVVEHMAAKKIQPVAVVWLTDGYVDSWPTGVTVPQVWGITAHPGHTPPQPANGKLIVIDETL